jgi:hypothetical protein
MRYGRALGNQALTDQKLIRACVGNMETFMESQPRGWRGRKQTGMKENYAGDNSGESDANYRSGDRTGSTQRGEMTDRD